MSETTKPLDKAGEEMRLAAGAVIIAATNQIVNPTPTNRAKFFELMEEFTDAGAEWRLSLARARGESQ